jgi:hypothetical protein
MADQAFYIEQMNQLAEVGAALCCYLPGSGNPDEWPTARCDCKCLPDLFSVLRSEYIQLGDDRVLRGTASVASDGHAARAGGGDRAGGIVGIRPST